jgi:hypothetical protein
MLVTKYGHVITVICDKSKLTYREYALVPPKGVAPVTPTLATRGSLFPRAALLHTDNSE